MLSAVDFVAGPATTPWTPAWDVDLRPGLDGVMAHLTDALTARRKTHEMGAIFSGKLPHAAAYIAGGLTSEITSEKIDQFQDYLIELTDFINNIYIPDVQAVGSVYPDYFTMGTGPENLLAYGGFDEFDGTKLFEPGAMEQGDTNPGALDTGAITEHVAYSWYEDGSALHPASGSTDPLHPKTDAYSWLKSPRYNDKPFETGPLARMIINGNYSGTISTMDRHVARSQEALIIANAMNGWLGEINSGSGYDDSFSQGTGNGEGLAEAPRGALGHWVNIGSDGNISNYQVITPTCWNASPMDDLGIKGPLEQALVGTPIIDETQPVEVLRIIHSYDPCLACAVHVMRPSGETVNVIHTGGE